MTYYPSANEFTSTDVVSLFCLIAIVVMLEILFCLLVRQSEKVRNLLLSLFGVCNILSVNLLLNSEFVSLPTTIQILSVLVGMYVLFTIFGMMDDLRRVGWAITIISGLVFSVLFVRSLLEIELRQFEDPLHGFTSASNIRKVEFQNTPNVYMISFDSLIPRALASQYLGLDSVAYHDVLDHFYRIPNFFADYIATESSLQSLLALDREYYQHVTRGFGRYSRIFQGHVPSPLLQTFKHNGYSTTTLFNGNYFGQDKGPYVDHYVRTSTIGVCQFIDQNVFSFVFMGYCRIQEVNMPNFLSHWFSNNNAQDKHVNKGKTDSVEHLLDHMQKAVTRERDHSSYWLMFTYLAILKVHTISNHKLISKHIASFIKKVVRLLQKH